MGTRTHRALCGALAAAAGPGQLRNGQDVDYAGAAGAADYDEQGDVITPIEIWRFAGGQIETVQIQPAEEIPSE